MKYIEMKEEIMKDLVASKWIKNAVKELEERDVVDVLNELYYLREMFGKRYEELVGGTDYREWRARNCRDREITCELVKVEKR